MASVDTTARDPRAKWVRAEFWVGDKVKVTYQVSTGSNNIVDEVYSGTVTKIIPKESLHPDSVTIFFDTDNTTETLRRRGDRKNKKRQCIEDIVRTSSIESRKRGTLEANQRVVVTYDDGPADGGAPAPAPGGAAAAVAAAAVVPAFTVIRAGFERVTGCFAICCKPAEATAKEQWWIPWVRIGDGDAQVLVDGSNVSWQYDVFESLHVALVYEKPEDDDGTNRTGKFRVHDLNAFVAWAACRNVLLAHQRRIVSKELIPGYLDTVLKRSRFDGSSMKDGLNELLAWLLIINFAGDNSEARGIGWQHSHLFLAEFNKQAKSLPAIVGSGDTTVRGFNDGMDPANYLGPSVYPNDKIDGKIAGASAIWAAKSANDFGTANVVWQLHSREVIDLLAPNQLLRGVRNLQPCPPQYGEMIATLRSHAAANPTPPDADTSDDGGDRHSAHLQHEEDIDTCGTDQGGISNATGAYEGPSPVTGRLQSLFGSLAHEWAITEILGLAYSVRGQAEPAFEEAAGQMRKLDKVVAEFPSICCRVGSILATRLAQNAADVSGWRSGIDHNAAVQNTIEVGAAVPSLVTVDLLSAVPYTYPPLAAVPDALFRMTSEPGGPVIVVGEFKTQWKASRGGFRWTVNEGLTYQRQAMFEACAHYLTCGDPDQYTPVQPWVVVVKTPAVSSVIKSVAYSANCNIDTLQAMEDQVRLFYFTLYPGEVSAPRIPLGFMSPYRYVPETSRYHLKNGLGGDVEAASGRLPFKRCPIPDVETKSGFCPGLENTDKLKREYWYAPAKCTIESTMAGVSFATIAQIGASGTIYRALYEGANSADVTVFNSKMAVATLRQLAIDTAVTCGKSVESTWPGKLADFISTEPLPKTEGELKGGMEMILADAYVQKDELDALYMRTVAETDYASTAATTRTRRTRRMKPFDYDVFVTNDRALKLCPRDSITVSNRQKLDEFLKAWATGTFLLNPPGLTWFGYKIETGPDGVKAAVPVIRPATLDTVVRNGDTRRYADYRMYYNNAAIQYAAGGITRGVKLSSLPEGTFIEPEVSFHTASPTKDEFYKSDWPTFSYKDEESYFESSKRLNRDLARALEGAGSRRRRQRAAVAPSEAVAAKGKFKVGTKFEIYYEDWEPKNTWWKATVTEQNVNRNGSLRDVTVRWDKYEHPTKLTYKELLESESKGILRFT